MIRTQSPNTKIMDLTGYACAQQVPVITLPKESPKVDFCYCDFECEYMELVFASTDEVKNDVRSFLVELAHSSSTFGIKLVQSTGEEFLIQDDTFGKFFAKGTLSQPLKAGAYIDFKKVYELKGAGIYYVEISVTNFGTTLTTQSHKYQLFPFITELADETVKIEAYSNAYFSTGIDYTGLNWYKAFRIPGMFGKPAIQLEQDTYQNNDREELTVQDKFTKKYTLETSLIPSSISNLFIYDTAQSDDLYISDFNIFNHEVYRRTKVVLKEIGEFTYFEQNRNGAYKMTFQSKKTSIKTLK